MQVSGFFSRILALEMEGKTVTDHAPIPTVQ